MRPGHAVLLALALCACATAQPEVRTAPVPPPVDAGPPPPPVDPLAAVEPLRAEARLVLKAQSELVWKHWTTGETIDLGQSTAAHPALFTASAIARVQAAEAQQPADGGSRRALEHLELYLASERLAQATAAIGEQMAAIEGAATVTVEGSEVPFRNLEQALANEPSHPRRLAMAAAAAPVLARLTPLAEQRAAMLAQQLSALGYASEAAFAARLREADLEALAALSEQLLTDTDALYQRALTEAAHRELNLPLAELHRADLPRFFHTSAVQSAFPAPQQLPRLLALLKGLGVDLATRKGVTIDSRVLPRKNPRPLCVAVSVPDDVRLSVKPQGGADEEAQLFHEGAHAAHFSATTEPVWELQQLGDGTVAEALARLFEDLLSDPRYLGELGMTGELLERDVRSRAVKQLYQARKEAALLLLERAARGPGALQGDAFRSRARELLSRAEGVVVDDTDASRELLARPDFFESADALRARLLAASLDAQLTSKFGERWWHHPEAGAFLGALWAQGTALSPAAFAHQLGQDKLDPAPLVSTLQGRLRAK